MHAIEGVGRVGGHDAERDLGTDQEDKKRDGRPYYFLVEEYLFQANVSD